MAFMFAVALTGSRIECELKRMKRPCTLGFILFVFTYNTINIKPYVYCYTTLIMRRCTHILFMWRAVAVWKGKIHPPARCFFHIKHIHAPLLFIVCCSIAFHLCHIHIDYDIIHENKPHSNSCYDTMETVCPRLITIYPTTLIFTFNSDAYHMCIHNTSTPYAHHKQHYIHPRWHRCEACFCYNFEDNGFLSIVLYLVDFSEHKNLVIRF